MTWLLGGGGEADYAAPTPATPPSPSSMGEAEMPYGHESFTFGDGELKK
jgi:hypothetical protein